MFTAATTTHRRNTIPRPHQSGLQEIIETRLWLEEHDWLHALQRSPQNVSPTFRFPDLISACRAILVSKPLFVVITAYAIRASALSLYYSLSEKLVDLGGMLECGELVSVERSARRVLSHAIYARWRGVP